MDAARSALNSLGYNNVEIVVTETGWPSKGDDKEPWATIDKGQGLLQWLDNPSSVQGRDSIDAWEDN